LEGAPRPLPVHTERVDERIVARRASGEVWRGRRAPSKFNDPAP
jgi:hypothetical protein